MEESSNMMHCHVDSKTGREQCRCMAMQAQLLHTCTQCMHVKMTYGIAMDMLKLYCCGDLTSCVAGCVARCVLLFVGSMYFPICMFLNACKALSLSRSEQQGERRPCASVACTTERARAFCTPLAIPMIQHVALVLNCARSRPITVVSPVTRIIGWIH